MNNQYIHAASNLARCLQAGLGCRRDVDAALYWLKLASSDCGIALTQLGTSFELGVSVEINRQRAVELYHQAAQEYEDQGAQLALARCYEFGSGCQKDLAKSKRFYNRSVKINTESPRMGIMLDSLQYRKRALELRARLQSALAECQPQAAACGDDVTSSAAAAVAAPPTAEMSMFQVSEITSLILDYIGDPSVLVVGGDDCIKTLSVVDSTLQHIVQPSQRLLLIEEIRSRFSNLHEAPDAVGRKLHRLLHQQEKNLSANSLHPLPNGDIFIHFPLTKRAIILDPRTLTTAFQLDDFPYHSVLFLKSAQALPNSTDPTPTLALLTFSPGKCTLWSLTYHQQQQQQSASSAADHSSSHTTIATDDSRIYQIRRVSQWTGCGNIKDTAQLTPNEIVVSPSAWLKMTPMGNILVTDVGLFSLATGTTRPLYTGLDHVQTFSVALLDSARDLVTSPLYALNPSAAPTSLQKPLAVPQSEQLILATSSIGPEYFVAAIDVKQCKNRWSDLRQAPSIRRSQPTVVRKFRTRRPNMIPVCSAHLKVDASRVKAVIGTDSVPTALHLVLVSFAQIADEHMQNNHGDVEEAPDDQEADEGVDNDPASEGDNEDGGGSEDEDDADDFSDDDEGDEGGAIGGGGHAHLHQQDILQALGLDPDDPNLLFQLQSMVMNCPAPPAPESELNVALTSLRNPSSPNPDAATTTSTSSEPVPFTNYSATARQDEMLFDFYVVVFDLASGRPLQIINVPQHEREISKMLVVDSNTVQFQSADGCVSLWQIENVEEAPKKCDHPLSPFRQSDFLKSPFTLQVAAVSRMFSGFLSDSRFLL